jgi:signal transduction histidine kinase/DNA-binding response OmpR family regulator/streptogramin lyase
MLKLSATFLILLFSFSLYGQKQQWDIETITVEDGLRSDGVTAIIKDRQGYMWFATKMGLHRYDGYKYKTYKYDLNDPVSLSHNRVSDLYQDHEGNLWISTADGINVLNPETDQIAYYLHDPEDSTSVSEGLRKRVFVDSKGTVWVGGPNSLDQLNKDTGEFTHYRHNPKDSSTIGGRYISCIYEDKQNNMWIGIYGGWGGLNKMDRTTGTFQRFTINPEDSLSWSNAIMCIYEDHSNNFWIGTGNGLFLFDREEHTYSRVLQELDNDRAPQSQMFAAVLEGRNGNYWIRTFSGLFQFDSNSKRINTWKNMTRNPILSVWEHIRSIYQDDNGIMWYSKHYDGIVKLIPKKNRFRFYVNPRMENKSISNIHLDDNNVIWIRYINGGLFRFDRTKNVYEQFQHNPKDPGSISSNRITEIFRDHKGTLWVGTLDGLNRLEISEKNNYKFVHYKHNPDDPTSIAGDNINQIHEGQSDRLYISNYGNIDIYDRENDSFLHLEYSKSILKSSSLLFRILLEEKNILWICHPGTGLLKFILPLRESGQHSLTPDTIIQYNAKADGLSLNNISCMHKDASGIYWIGTEGGGLNKMIITKNQIDGTKETRFENFTESDGLCNDIVNDIHEDDNGRLWLTTENGISRFDPVTESFTNYDKTDGLKTYTFSFWGSKSPSGELFFPSEYGLLIFHPDSIKDNPNIPPVVITDFLINNKKVSIGGKSPLQTSISYASNIELSHHQNFLSLEFAALNFLHPEKNQYKYKMEGLDEDWIEAGTRRFARYPDLRPGTYTFRVIGSNDDNVWNMQGASLKITINPPWYGSLLAYIVYGILAILLILVYIRWRTREVSKERDKLENEVKGRTRQLEDHKEEIERQKEVLEEQHKKILQIDELKTRFFNNISHEFRTPLTLIQGSLEDLMEHARLSKREIKKLELISRNSEQLLKLVNQLLDIAKLDSGHKKLKLVNGDILHSLRIIVGSFTPMAETRGILYNRSIPIGKYNTWFDYDILEKIVSNLLSNAFKFTPEAGEVTFRAHWFHGETPESPDQLEFSISDQGPGIPEDSMDKIFTRFYQVEGESHPTTAGTGIGLSLVKDLVKLNHGEIKVDSDLGKGSTFTVQFPLGKNHLTESEYIIASEKEPLNIAPNRKEEIVLSEKLTNELRKPLNNEIKPVVLVVDDNADIRNHISENLESKYQIIEAVNGRAGLKKAQEIIPDLMITDLIMPIMDGIELCRQIRIDERTSHIPIIMLTAKTSMEEKLVGLETGADDYISKPFHMKELISRIANLIEQRKTLRERFSKEIILEPYEISITSMDEAFLTRAIETIEKHLNDEKFDISKFQKAMHMSHSTLFRKLQALTNLSPSGFIRNIRLKRAAQMLSENYGNVAEVSYEVGFSNPAYFSKCFKNLFGMSPMDYLHKSTQKI